MRYLSAAIVLPLVLLGQLSQADTEVITSTKVSCTTQSVNLFTNPSFETGSTSPWKSLIGPMTPISVISDNTEDGQYAAQLSWVGSPNYAMSQTVTGLQVGTTYTFSFDYKITQARGYTTCMFYAAHDTTIVLERATAYYSPSAGQPWNTLSATLTATSSSHTFTMWAFCSLFTVYQLDSHTHAQLTAGLYPDSSQQCGDHVPGDSIQLGGRFAFCNLGADSKCNTFKFTHGQCASVLGHSGACCFLSCGLLGGISVLVGGADHFFHGHPISFCHPSAFTWKLFSCVVILYYPGLGTNFNPIIICPTIQQRHTEFFHFWASIAVLITRTVRQSFTHISSFFRRAGGHNLSLVECQSLLHSRGAFEFLLGAARLSLTLVESSSDYVLVQPSILPSLIPRWAIESIIRSQCRSNLAHRSFCTVVCNSYPLAAVHHIDCPNHPDCYGDRLPVHCPRLPCVGLTEATTSATSTADVHPSSLGESTTSTIFTTRTATITACPSSMTNCPASHKSTYTTTETVLVSTTICPVTAAERPTITGVPGPATTTGSHALPGGGSVDVITSTVLTTRTATVTACPSTVPNCPATAKSTFVTTETLVASTVVLTVERAATPTAIPTIPAAGSPSTSTSESGSTNEQGTGHESSSDTASGAQSGVGTAVNAHESAPYSTAGSASSGGKDVAPLGANGDVPNYNHTLPAGTPTSLRTSTAFRIPSSRPSSLTSTAGSSAASLSTSSQASGSHTVTGTAASALFTGSASPAATGSSFGLLFVAIATLIPFLFS
ncbi:hypothetical protein CNMCM5793_005107 [Aspergillus hiratsukae]|uniref:CBM-cenC domain-containing protein n=1 Tax=Aspergillus hiratsukae TaxID=1194566 RepID=A0A8H6PGG3_9EURO|nr:hypothetical protein CNMCM5793_005107 [Aspergillus hiratsukae]